MGERGNLRGQSRQLTCCWKNTPHAMPTMCLIGWEGISVLGLLLNPGGMSIGKEISIISSLIFRWRRRIGAARLLCILNIRLGASIRGHHVLQGQRVTFNQNGFRRGMCSDQICKRKGLVSIIRLDHMMPL